MVTLKRRARRWLLRTLGTVTFLVLLNGILLWAAKCAFASTGRPFPGVGQVRGGLAFALFPDVAGAVDRKVLPSTEDEGYPTVNTPDNFAARFGYSGNHIRDMVKRGDIAGFKFGGKLLRISVGEVLAYEARGYPWCGFRWRLVPALSQRDWAEIIFAGQ